MATKKRNFKREILNYLKKNGTQTSIKDVAEGIKTTKVTVARHLMKLFYEGVVEFKTINKKRKKWFLKERAAGIT